jgi:hypothetical protein
VGFWLLRGERPWSIADFIVLGAFALMFALMFAYGAQFKRVNLFGACLVVSDGKREAHVPLGCIIRIEQTLRPGYAQHWPNRDAVVVLLDRPTLFGRKIVFMTRASRSFLASRENSCVLRLRQARAEHSMTMECLHQAPMASQPTAGPS